MVRVISQETFDGVVKENVEDLEMSPEEAIKEAKEQFIAQGVDLSNIVIPDSGVTHKVLEALQNLNLEEPQNVEENCNVVASECAKGLAERVLATKTGQGYTILIKTLNDDETNGSNIKVAAMRALTNLLEGNPDSLEPEGFTVLIEGLESGNPDLVSSTLECVLNCCVQHEHNRQNLIRNHLLHFLDRPFEQSDDVPSKQGDIVRVVRIWQALVQDDDVRVPFGQAHENARQIVEHHGALEKLTSAINKSSETKEEKVLMMSCLSSLSVRNEYCQTVVNSGGLKCLLDLLINPDQDKVIIKEALNLLKVLAGNDNVKKDIQSSNGIQVIINSISKHVSVKSICWAGCAVISAVCLRTPGNATQVMESGGGQLLTQILKTHMDSSKVLISCCSAIRNVVSRSKEFVDEFVSLDTETLLHEVMKKHPSAEEAAKSALRDLGLKVELKEVWTGGAVKQTHN